MLRSVCARMRCASDSIGFLVFDASTDNGPSPSDGGSAFKRPLEGRLIRRIFSANALGGSSFVYPTTKPGFCGRYLKLEQVLTPRPLFVPIQAVCI